MILIITDSPLLCNLSRNVKLLSFAGDEEDGDNNEAQSSAVFKKKAIVRPDRMSYNFLVPRF